MTGRSVLSAPRLFDGERWHDDAALILHGGTVEALVSARDIPAGMTVERIEGALVPGSWSRIQVNGGGGVMLNDHPDVASIETICAAHAPFGTTALLATLITDTPAITAAAVEAGVEAARRRVPGFLGLHLEGPAVSRSRARARTTPG